MSRIQLGRVPVGDGAPVCVVAKGNLAHGGNLERGLELITAAGGIADAFTFQRFYTEYLASRDAVLPGHAQDAQGRTQQIPILDELWLGQPAHDAFKADAHRNGLEFWLTVYDRPSVDDAVRLGVPAIKIGSGDTDELDLIGYAASKSLPLILSTGFSTLDEVTDAVRAAKDGGCRELVLEQNTTIYPLPPDKADLRVITLYRQLFPEAVIGWSDQTLDPIVPMVAVCAGAKVHDRHVKLDEPSQDWDSGISTGMAAYREVVANIRATECVLADRGLAFTDNPAHMLSMVRDALGEKFGAGPYQAHIVEATIQDALGSPQKRFLADLDNFEAHRKSPYAIRDIWQGDIFHKGNTRLLRPRTGGLHPREYARVLQYRWTAAQNIPAGTQLTPALIEGFEP